MKTCPSCLEESCDCLWFSPEAVMTHRPVCAFTVIVFTMQQAGISAGSQTHLSLITALPTHCRVTYNRVVLPGNNKLNQFDNAVQKTNPIIYCDWHIIAPAGSPCTSQLVWVELKTHNQPPACSSGPRLGSKAPNYGSPALSSLQRTQVGALKPCCFAGKPERGSLVWPMATAKCLFSAVFTCPHTTGSHSWWSVWTRARDVTPVHHSL